MQRFFIPFTGVKETLQANRIPKNLNAKAAKIQRIQELTRQALFMNNVQPIPTPVRCIVTIQRPDQWRRYDPNNWSPTTKAVMDAIVKAGLMEDDNAELLQGPDHRKGETGSLGIWVEFTQWEQQQ